MEIPFLPLLLLLALEVLCWPYLILPENTQIWLGKPTTGPPFGFEFPPLTGIGYSILMNALVIAGLWIFWRRTSLRGYKRMVLALICLAIPAGVPVAARLASTVGSHGIDNHKQTRKVTLSVNIARNWNETDPDRFAHSLKITAAGPERLLFKVRDQDGDIVSYDVGDGKVRHQVARSEWLAAHCLPVVKSSSTGLVPFFETTG